MKCPNCGATDWKTLETRRDDERNGYRRRKQCNPCGQRVTTLETQFVFEAPPRPATKPKEKKTTKPRAKAVLKNRVKAMMEIEKKRDRAYDYWSADNDFIPEKW